MNRPINILLVDDDARNLTALEAVLDTAAYRLIRAESAEQALLALMAEDFALLILDIRMPDMTGFELAQMIKNRRKTSRVPIIFLTAYYNEDQHVLAGYDTGAVDYLYKPVNPAILRSKVAVFAELYRKTREVEDMNRTLLSEVVERRLAEDRLRELNENLEQRVAERTEAVREADRHKDVFLATLAHELRNPLAPVRSAVHVLNVKCPRIPEVQWATEVIDRQMQAMTRLIDDLMDVSRINQDRIELKRAPVELSAVVQQAIETSLPLIEERGHELTVGLPGDRLVLNGDRTRLAQVIWNLLNNAAKYMERGGRIALRVERQGSDVVLSVKDDGIGIAPHRITNIFGIFARIPGAMPQSEDGLGIGLFLVKRLVEMHGGHVEARSEGLGKGSEFTIRLPIVVEPDPERAPLPPELATLTSDLRVLVVDDNRDAAATLAMTLKLMGNQVRMAHEGLEAVQGAAEFRPHVVLLDIGLPKMNGYEVARAIRQEPWGEKMVLIAVTGWGLEADRRMSSEAGFDRHLVKPVEPRVLVELLAGLSAVKA